MSAFARFRPVLARSSLARRFAGGASHGHGSTEVPKTSAEQFAHKLRNLGGTSLRADNKYFAYGYGLALGICIVKRTIFG